MKSKELEIEGPRKGNRWDSYKTEKADWKSILVHFPKSMRWLPHFIQDVARSKSKSPGAVLREAFCKVYGEDDAELRAKFEKWEEIHGEK